VDVTHGALVVELGGVDQLDRPLVRPPQLRHHRDESVLAPGAAGGAHRQQVADRSGQVVGAERAGLQHQAQ